jgi:hypothetical protein
MFAFSRKYASSTRATTRVAPTKTIWQTYYKIGCPKKEAVRKDSLLKIKILF